MKIWNENMGRCRGWKKVESQAGFSLVGGLENASSSGGKGRY